MPLDSAVCKSQTKERVQNIPQTLAAAFYIDLQMKITSTVILAPPLHSHLCGKVTQHLQLCSRWKDMKKKKGVPIGVLDLNTNVTQISGNQDGNFILQCVDLIRF